MPTYCFRDGRGKTVELFMTVTEMSRRTDKTGRIFHEGRFLRRDMAAEHGGFRNTPGNWPKESDALGCAPDQIPHFMDVAKKAGASINFKPDGTCVVADKASFKRFAEARGLYSRNAGYGDPRRK